MNLEAENPYTEKPRETCVTKFHPTNTSSFTTAFITQNSQRLLQLKLNSNSQLNNYSTLPILLYSIRPFYFITMLNEPLLPCSFTVNIILSYTFHLLHSPLLNKSHNSIVKHQYISLHFKLFLSFLSVFL